MTRIGNRRGFSLAESRRLRESSVVEPEKEPAGPLARNFCRGGPIAKVGNHRNLFTCP